MDVILRRGSWDLVFTPILRIRSKKAGYVSKSILLASTIDKCVKMAVKLGKMFFRYANGSKRWSILFSINI